MTDLSFTALTLLLIYLSVLLIANILRGGRGQRTVSNLMTVGGCCAIWIAAVVGSIMILLSASAK